MVDVRNPLIPVASDVAWSVCVLLAATLAVVALVSLVRTATRLSAAESLGWTALVVLIPVIGPVAWLAIGRRSSRGFNRDSGD